jgi:hypothetical protein
MSNPYTHFLGHRLPRGSLADFIGRWDRLEELVIAVYKSGAATPADAEHFATLREWLGRRYPRFEQALRPHWQVSTVGGRPAETDPFAALLAYRSAADLVGEWRAMQLLPAAREALNRLLMEMNQSNPA